MKTDTIIINARQIATLASGGKAKYGAQMDDANIIENAGIAIKDGIIIDLGCSKVIEDKYDWEEAIDASGKILTPGFVDSHSHPVFVHTRENEFAARLAGSLM